jgi:hypothetical protein
MVASSYVRPNVHSVIASEAKQSKGNPKILDRFVASLLAMTGSE